MTLESIFLASFVFGLVLTAGSFFGGHVHLHIGHLHLGHAHGKGGHWFNLFSMAGFLCWFGGVGYLLLHTRHYSLWFVFPCAIASGLVAASVLSLFLTRVLLQHDRPLLPEDTEMRGVLAEVSQTVRPGFTGEILFSLNGTRRASAARSTQELTRGTEVVVTDYARGVAWVTPFHAERN
jgi:membrane protein implicated in regulation of membrane protease activity